MLKHLSLLHRLPVSGCIQPQGRDEGRGVMAAADRDTLGEDLRTLAHVEMKLARRPLCRNQARSSGKRSTLPSQAASLLLVAESPLWPKEKVDVIEVDEGAPLSLQCNPPPGLPPPVIFWMSSCESGNPPPTLNPMGAFPPPAVFI